MTRAKLPSGVRYVLDLADKGRARHVGYMAGTDTVEFRVSGGGNIVDQLTIKQLRALGWTVERNEYGARIEAAGNQVLFTPWPVDQLASNRSRPRTRSERRVRL